VVRCGTEPVARFWSHATTRSASIKPSCQCKEAGFGLYDYNARMYDPYLGRFLSADTVVPNPGNPQDYNRYAYVENNPLKYIDPSGHLYTDPGLGGTRPWHGTPGLWRPPWDTEGVGFCPAPPFEEGDHIPVPAGMTPVEFLAHLGNGGDSLPSAQIGQSPQPRPGSNNGAPDVASGLRSMDTLLDYVEVAGSAWQAGRMLAGGFRLAEGASYPGQILVYGSYGAKTVAGVGAQFTHAASSHGLLGRYTSPWGAAAAAARGQAVSLVLVYGADVWEYASAGNLVTTEFASALVVDTGITLGPPAAGAAAFSWAGPVGTVTGAGLGVVWSIGLSGEFRSNAIEFVDAGLSRGLTDCTTHAIAPWRCPLPGFNCDTC
jgi:RHS repeat-associated protein